MSASASSSSAAAYPSPNALAAERRKRAGDKRPADGPLARDGDMKKVRDDSKSPDTVMSSNIRGLAIDLSGDEPMPNGPANILAAAAVAPVVSPVRNGIPPAAAAAPGGGAPPAAAAPGGAAAALAPPAAAAAAAPAQMDAKHAEEPMECLVCSTPCDGTEHAPWQCPGCRRGFHLACIQDWERTRAKYKAKLSCPHCRRICPTALIVIAPQVAELNKRNEWQRILGDVQLAVVGIADDHADPHIFGEFDDGVDRKAMRVATMRADQHHKIGFLLTRIANLKKLVDTIPTLIDKVAAINYAIRISSSRT